jgi:hypothetical protein
MPPGICALFKNVGGDGHVPTTAGRLDFSGTAETDADFASLDDDGYLAAPIGEL